MNAEVALDRLAEIRETAPTDPAAAHVLEDRYHRETLEAIAAGNPAAAELAALALSTSAIKFRRLYE